MSAIDDAIVMLRILNEGGRDKHLVRLADFASTDLAALRAHDAEAMEMLRELEWATGVLDEEFGKYWCPVCGNAQKKGHAPDCKLNALLQRTTSEGSQP